MKLPSNTALGLWISTASIFIALFIAWAGGVFDRGVLALDIAESKLEPSTLTRVFIAVPPSAGAMDIVYFPWRLNVRNKGNKQLANVLLSMEYDKRSNYSTIDMEPFMSAAGSRFKGDILHEKNIGASADHSNFTLRSLNPDEDFSFYEGAQLYQDVSAQSFFEMALLRAEVKVTLTADNEKRSDYAISYRGVHAAGCDELILRYETEYAPYIGVRIRDQSTFLAYLWHLLRSTDMRSDYLLCPAYQSAVVGGRNVWMPTGDDGVVRILSFAPYAWGLLLQR